LKRALVAGLCLVALPTLSCCGHPFGGPRVRRVRLEVSRRGDDVEFRAHDARDLFGVIVCSVYDAASGRGGPPEPVPGNAPGASRSVRMIWRARCPNGNDCARAISYGDTRLASDLPPAPLVPSRPSECYLCSVSGDRRRGEVLFAIAADGAIVDCPVASRKR
jgi:hypothetical protein